MQAALRNLGDAEVDIGRVPVQVCEHSRQMSDFELQAQMVTVHNFPFNGGYSA